MNGPTMKRVTYIFELASFKRIQKSNDYKYELYVCYMFLYDKSVLRGYDLSQLQPQKIKIENWAFKLNPRNIPRKSIKENLKMFTDVLHLPHLIM